MNSHRTFALASIVVLTASSAAIAEPPNRDEAAAALHKAARFFHDKVSIEGAYLWRYSDDLSLREGETKATATLAWVQPPGTPEVGEALLTAYERTGEKQLLAAAVAAARALVKGQLHSGGWDYRIEFDPRERKRYAYRVDGAAADRVGNVTTLDDDNTQSAVRFLIHIDQVLEKNAQPDARIHEATMFAMESLLAAQYPSGAWPQRFSGPPQAEKFPVLKASYPDEWPRTWPNVKYAGYYTLNDQTLADTIALMFEAAETYGDQRLAAAGRRGGDFLILAQLPDPQPAWAQQYNAQMQPAWARKFEPPSVTGGESQGAIRILMEVYRRTGDRKYLEPIPRALDYLEKSALPGGRMARFYELQTNKPLYFTKQYELVYTADDLPTHYAFITTNNLAKIRREYERLLATDAAKLRPPRKTPKYEMSESLAQSARRAIDALDARGAWVEEGRLRGDPEGSDSEGKVRRIMTTQTFAKNVEILSRFIAASR